jgi:hypothetical protein
MKLDIACPNGITQPDTGFQKIRALVSVQFTLTDQFQLLTVGCSQAIMVEAALLPEVLE